MDYKAGAPRDGEDTRELWPADRMQLGLQMLILRDNGYTCREGMIYYRATKQRVRLPWTDDLEAWVREQVDLARRTATGPIPPPLVASPKCVRCYPINALLSLAYSLLSRDCTVAALAVGFDPYVGFFHQPPVRPPGPGAGPDGGVPAVDC